MLIAKIIFVVYILTGILIAGIFEIIRTKSKRWSDDQIFTAASITTAVYVGIPLAIFIWLETGLYLITILGTVLGGVITYAVVLRGIKNMEEVRQETLRKRREAAARGEKRSLWSIALEIIVWVVAIGFILYGLAGPFIYPE